MKSAAPVKTYQHRSKPYSVLPKTANISNRGLNTLARKEKVQNISALQESVAKMEVGYSFRSDTAAPTIKPYQCCNEVALVARALRVPEIDMVSLARTLNITSKRRQRNVEGCVVFAIGLSTDSFMCVNPI